MTDRTPEDAINEAWGRYLVRASRPRNTHRDDNYEALIAGFDAGRAYERNEQMDKPPVTDAARTNRILREVSGERERARQRYPIEHDDQHGPVHLVEEVRLRTAFGEIWDQPVERIRAELVKSAGLLVSAIEVLDRTEERRVVEDAEVEELAKILLATHDGPDMSALVPQIRENYRKLARAAIAHLKAKEQP